MEVVVARIAGLDVHKETVMAVVRVPGEAGKRRQVVREFSTFTAELVHLREWLGAEGVTPGGDGSYRGLLAPGLACLGGRAGLGADVGQRPAREEPARAQDRRVGLGVAGPAGRVWACCVARSCRRR